MTARLLLALLLFLGAPALARAQADLASQRECASCGMDRKAYGYSRMLIGFEEGPDVGVCSLHCAVAVIDARPARRVRSIAVADRATHELIDAARAAWVMGGGKRGVMTQRPKWAFRTQAGAAAFIAAHGGVHAPWEKALAAARAEIAAKRPEP